MFQLISRTCMADKDFIEMRQADHGDSLLEALPTFSSFLIPAVFAQTARKDVPQNKRLSSPWSLFVSNGKDTDKAWGQHWLGVNSIQRGCKHVFAPLRKARRKLSIKEGSVRLQRGKSLAAKVAFPKASRAWEGVRQTPWQLIRTWGGSGRFSAGQRCRPKHRNALPRMQPASLVRNLKWLFSDMICTATAAGAGLVHRAHDGCETLTWPAVQFSSNATGRDIGMS